MTRSFNMTCILIGACLLMTSCQWLKQHPEEEKVVEAVAEDVVKAAL